MPLTLSELSKIVKIFPINESNQINYESFLDRLNLSDACDHKPITYEEFISKLKSNVFNSERFPYALPISVRRLTAELQSTLFKDQ